MTDLQYESKVRVVLHFLISNLDIFTLLDSKPSK